MLTILNIQASYFAISSKIIGPERKQGSTLSVLMTFCLYLHNIACFVLRMWALGTF